MMSLFQKGMHNCDYMRTVNSFWWSNFWQVLSYMYWIQPGNVIKSFRDSLKCQTEKNVTRGILNLLSKNHRWNQIFTASQPSAAHIREICFILHCEPPSFLVCAEIPHLVEHVYEWKHPGVNKGQNSEVKRRTQIASVFSSVCVYINNNVTQCHEDSVEI